MVIFVDIFLLVLCSQRCCLQILGFSDELGKDRDILDLLYID